MKSTVSPDIDQQMAQDVLSGLTSEPRRLPSRYFYDNRGSELFREIMHMDTYYPMNCEYEIFEQQTSGLIEAFTEPGLPFRLVEFGAGDGHKTKLLLAKLLKEGKPFTYQPIDISEGAIDGLAEVLKKDFPDLDFRAVVGEYFDALHRINESHGQGHKVILFLGSNIGNFLETETITFLKALAREVSPQDRVLIGFDLKKDPGIILPAYSDPWGITRAFNLNLLTRFNRELGADFNLENWEHFASYDPLTGKTKSYLISQKEQKVHFEALGTSFDFGRWEPIWTELSQKYDAKMIEHLAQKSGFQVLTNFYDDRGYFVDSVWALKES